MKRLINLFKSISIICIYISSGATYAGTADYLTDFKIPVQQTFCISKSPNGDMSSYKQCMLAIEKGSYKCDKVTKAAYDQMILRYIDYDKDVTELMSDMKPITKNHFDCLSALY